MIRLRGMQMQWRRWQQRFQFFPFNYFPFKFKFKIKTFKWKKKEKQADLIIEEPFCPCPCLLITATWSKSFKSDLGRRDTHIHRSEIQRKFSCLFVSCFVFFFNKFFLFVVCIFFLSLAAFTKNVFVIVLFVWSKVYCRCFTLYSITCAHFFSLSLF